MKKNILLNVVKLTSIALTFSWLFTFGNIYAQCTAVNVPYFENFETTTTPALPNCITTRAYAGNLWKTTNETDFGFSSNVAYYGYSSSADANSWLFSAPLNLTGGTSYRISFVYGSGYTNYVEKLKVALGTDTTEADMNVTLLNDSLINSGAAKTFTLDISIPTTGVYYLGFKAFSKKNQYRLFLDDISVDLSPSCIAPTNVKVNVSSYTTANAIWNQSNTVPGVGYEYYLSSSNLTPTIQETPTGNTLPGDTTVALTGLNPLQNYYFWVRSLCSTTDTSSWSNVAAFYTGVCTPNAYSGVYIQINSISTTGGINDISKLTSGFAPNGYGDYYLSDSLEMYKGDTVNLSFDIKSPFGARMAAYVDWNGNWAFDDEEEIFLTTSDITGQDADALYSGSFDIVVPQNTNPGEYRMRLIINKSSVNPTPCSIPDQFNGEAEDYKIVVKLNCNTFAIDLGADTSICSTESLTLSPNVQASSYIWSNGETTPAINVTTSGKYFVEVNSFGCVAKDSIQVTVNPIPNVTIQASATIICPNDEVTLTATGATSYLWEDGSTDAIRVVNPSQMTSYSVEGTSLNCSSNAQVTIATKTSGCNTAVFDETNTNFVIYPNPANHQLVISGDNLSQNFVKYTIVDLYGRMIVSSSIHSDKLIVDTDLVDDGIYFLILSGNGLTKVEKIEVKH